MVKALDLSSNGRMSAWVRTPLLVELHFDLCNFQSGFITINDTVYLLEPLPSVDILNDLHILNCKSSDINTTNHNLSHNDSFSRSVNASKSCLERLERKLQRLQASKVHPKALSAPPGAEKANQLSGIPYHVMYEHQWSPARSLSNRKNVFAAAEQTENKIKAGSGTH